MLNTVEFSVLATYSELIDRLDNGSFRFISVVVRQFYWRLPAAFRWPFLFSLNNSIPRAVDMCMIPRLTDRRSLTGLQYQLYKHQIPLVEVSFLQRKLYASLPPIRTTQSDTES
jgi:hypothetical protein